MQSVSTAARVYPKIVETTFAVEQELDFIDSLGTEYFLRDVSVKKELSIRYLVFLLTVADQREVTGLKSRVPTLQGQEERLSGLRPYSRRSASYALEELEAQGYIHRSGCRIAGNKGVIIRFLPKLLRLTQTLKHSLGHTQLKLVFKEDAEQGRIPADNRVHRQKVPPVKGTELPPTLKPIPGKQEANARAQKGDVIELPSRSREPAQKKPDTRVKPQKCPTEKTQRPSYGKILKFEALNRAGKKQKLNPVLWSVLHVAAQRKLPAKTQQAIAARGWLEVNAPEYLRPSGAGWSYFAQRWPSFRFDAREYHARAILEELLNVDQERPINGQEELERVLQEAGKADIDQEARLEESLQEELEEELGIAGELAGDDLPPITTMEEALERLQSDVEKGKISQEDALILFKVHAEMHDRKRKVSG